MTRTEIFAAAAALTGENDFGAADGGLAAQADPILDLLASELAALNAAYAEASNDTVHEDGNGNFTLHPRFAAPCAYYLASVFAAPDDPALSARLRGEYNAALETIRAEIPGRARATTDVYSGSL